MTHLGNATTRQRVLQRIAALKPDSTPRWGKMSSHQAICHLTDSFLVPMGCKKVSPATSVLQRTLVKWIALHAPMPWPKGVPTRPEVDQALGGTPPTDFRRDRCDLISAIEQFSDANRQFEWRPHPIFGVLDEREWLRWGYLHSDHHLRQFGV